MNLNTSPGHQRERAVFSSNGHSYRFNKSISVIEAASKAQSIGFVWTQTTQKLSKIKEGETFSTRNLVIYSKQENLRKFKF